MVTSAVTWVRMLGCGPGQQGSKEKGVHVKDV